MITPLSHFFILSPRGDVIISKKYREHGVASPAQLNNFFRWVRFSEGEPGNVTDRIPATTISEVQLLWALVILVLPVDEPFMLKLLCE